MAEEEDGAEVAEAPPKKKGKLILISSVAAIVLVGAGVAVPLYLSSQSDAEGEEEVQAEQEEARKEPIYYTLADNLVVNFQSRQGTRFLQVGINLMTYDASAVQALETHEPVLKAELILLLSDQTEETLLSRDGKEQLRAEALATLRSEMNKLHGDSVIEALHFTSFVMQ